MGWPERETVTLESVTVAEADGAVELLGHDGGIDHGIDDDGRVEIRLPDLAPEERPSDVAVAFELSGFDVS